MPTEKGNKKTLTVWIDQEAKQLLDEFTSRADVSRSKLVSNIIEVYGKELIFYNKLGFIYLAVTIRNLLERFKKEPAKKEGGALTIWVDKPLIESMDAIADKLTITRSKLVSNIIRTAIEELRTLDQLGVLHHSKVMKNLQDKVADDFKASIEEEGLTIDKKDL